SASMWFASLRRRHRRSSTPAGLPQFSRLMAVESWKICLFYQDENQQHKVLEGFMDRKDISFYELVKLIEEVGFSPAYGFLYYRKKYPRGRCYSDIASDHEILCVQSSPGS
uniref:Uncharacterized protein n=4 Tax=Triticinae TaxID=1648030 RepID=A0A453H7I2_AEGTS